MESDAGNLLGLSLGEAGFEEDWDVEQVREGASTTYATTVRRANDLDGATWTRYSISIWSDIRKSADEVALKHPAMFPSALAARLIECFTTRGMTVLDPFVGIGSTLIAAKQLGRKGIGIELNPDFADIARKRLQQKALFDEEEFAESIVITGDARHLSQYVPPGSAHLVVTSPPYWDILLEKRTADYKPIRHYGDEEHDMGKINDYDQFLSELQAIFAQVYDALVLGGYCCVVVMDIRKKGKFYPYHADLSARMQQIGFEWDDLIIWDRRQEYNSLRPLGYPSVFRVNKVHEFILIFQKR